MKVLVFVLLANCGASAATRSAYTITAADCIRREREIVDRPGTTMAQDQADLTAERERCDSALRTVAP